MLAAAAAVSGFTASSRTAQPRRTAITGLMLDALAKADVLATEDRRLAQRYTDLGGIVWGWDDLRAAILRHGT
jgi:hypothetical protein